MKRIISLLATGILLAGTVGAFAQPRDDHSKMDGPGMSMTMKGPSHADWKKGGHIAKDDWGRGAPINYREHHLKRPPRGYEWRQVDDNYVLAAAATGLIASVILASH